MFEWEAHALAHGKLHCKWRKNQLLLFKQPQTNQRPQRTLLRVGSRNLQCSCAGVCVLSLWIGWASQSWTGSGQCWGYSRILNWWGIGTRRVLDHFTGLERREISNAWSSCCCVSAAVMFESPTLGLRSKQEVLQGPSQQVPLNFSTDCKHWGSFRDATAHVVFASAAGVPSLLTLGHVLVVYHCMVSHS